MLRLTAITLAVLACTAAAASGAKPVRPVIGKPVTAPARAQAGKSFAVSFRITRSDTHRPLTRGKATLTPSADGKALARKESFKAGTARVSFVVPASARVVKVSVAVSLGDQGAFRTFSFPVQAPPPASTPPAGLPTQFSTGIFDPYMFMLSDAGTRELGFDQTRSAGATVVRLLVDWGDVAPSSGGFDARDPGASGYKWGNIDAQVNSAVAHGLSPIVDIFNAPRWADDGRGTDGIYDGPINPQPGPFGDFAYAAAKRYSGTFVPPGAGSPLPRVRYWQVWNEPNLGQFLLPQANAPAIYRALVNAFAASVHSVAADNVVVAGSTTPFGELPEHSTSPLRFMRDFLCVSDAPTPTATCGDSVAFDAWAHQPYTGGGPNHTAPKADDAEIGDLPKLRRYLDAAQKLGHIRTGSAAPVPLWVTEFSWDSNPPDPYGVDTATLERWIPEAFFRMWQAGVNVITWFKIRDEPYSPSSYWQSGLYTWDGGGTYTPKPLLAVFRFPFVALPSDQGITVWGRTPTSAAGAVTIERSVGSGWQPVLTLQANAAGLFYAAPVRSVANGNVLRAHFGSEVSHPFTVEPTPDRRVPLFGLYFDS